MVNRVEREPSYYAVIPANVRYCEALQPNAKLLYGEITALCNKEGYCWASNSYFAKLYGVDTRTIRRWLSTLRENGFIYYVDDDDENNTQRKICLNEGRTKMSHPEDKNVLPLGQKCPPPLGQKCPPNNTSNNIKNNIKGGRTFKAFQPPSLDEVQEYIKEKKYNVDAKKFIDYFEANDWTDSKGNKVKSWKQKIITWSSYRQTPNVVTESIAPPIIPDIDRFVSQQRALAEEAKEAEEKARNERAKNIRSARDFLRGN